MWGRSSTWPKHPRSCWSEWSCRWIVLGHSRARRFRRWDRGECRISRRWGWHPPSLRTQQCGCGGCRCSRSSPRCAQESVLQIPIFTFSLFITISIIFESFLQKNFFSFIIHKCYYLTASTLFTLIFDPRPSTTPTRQCDLYANTYHPPRLTIPLSNVKMPTSRPRWMWLRLIMGFAWFLTQIPARALRLISLSS